MPLWPLFNVVPVATTRGCNIRRTDSRMPPEEQTLAG
jgi:hypothetical protein